MSQKKLKRVQCYSIIRVKYFLWCHCLCDLL